LFKITVLSSFRDVGVRHEIAIETIAADQIRVEDSPESIFAAENGICIIWRAHQWKRRCLRLLKTKKVG
jgi:hypothetical protein